MRQATTSEGSKAGRAPATDAAPTLAPDENAKGDDDKDKGGNEPRERRTVEAAWDETARK